MDEKRSKTIKDGLTKAKNRGVRLGNPKLDEVRCIDTRAANAARVKSAGCFAEKMRSHFIRLVQNGINKPSEIAKELNKHQIPARRGGKWTTTQVQRIVECLLKVESPHKPQVEAHSDFEDKIIEQIFGEEE